MLPCPQSPTLCTCAFLSAATAFFFPVSSPPEPKPCSVVDDWGWANFAPHRAPGLPGNNEFLTPNLAALAGEGVLLNRLYAHKFCGPSRAAIQSGRLPIHVTVLDDNLA